MNRKSIVLYHNLLLDLSNHLPRHVIDSLFEGRTVEAWPDITPKQYAALALVKSFYKKNVDVTNADADDVALRKFLLINDKCDTWCLDLQHSWEEEAIGTVKRHLYNFFNPSGMPLVPSLTAVFAVGRCGPGSSIGSAYEDYYTKMYSSRQAATNSGLVSAYQASISAYPIALDAEKFRQREFGDAELVAGNRLSFVPKQKDTSRIICIEPSINMFGQLGLGSMLEKRLYSLWGIDLSLQPDRNRELAREGSVTGQFSTIDLSSASDSISTKMLEAILPGDVLPYFMLLRSPSCQLPDGRREQLNMVSTMGNGFTFPLETAIFTAVVLAAYDMHGLRYKKELVNVHGVKRKLCQNFGVFGDDIIVDTKVYSTVVRLLNILGFEINASKSFNQGPFRESCGGDFFLGHQTRGVYIKTLQRVQERVVVLNLLHRWSAETGIFLHETCRMLLRSVPSRLVPPWENDDAGIQVPFWMVDKMRRDKDTQSIKYYKWLPRSRSIDATIFERSGTHSRIHNPSGLLYSFVGGYIRNGRISLRLRETTYVTKPSLAPSWDPARTVLVSDTRWQRWNTAVWFTFR